MSELADAFSDMSIDDCSEYNADHIENPYFEEESIDEYPDSL
jgi:hypothetical protein